VIAQELLATWPAAAQKFVKVFPYEYQRALKLQAVRPAVAPAATNGDAVADIEDAVRDLQVDKKNLEKILDKTRSHSYTPIFVLLTEL
jgi:glutamate synthase (NADH)